jgi:hypothetical protein
MENFKPIPNYEGIYEVSNLGNVKSLKYGKEKILKPAVSSSGYFQVVLSSDNKPNYFRIHKLVAMAFLGHIPNGTQEIVVDHINNDKKDNRVENLQLIHQRENSSKDRIGSSKYTGASWHKGHKKWISQIYVNGKLEYLGLYSTPEEASEVYQNKLKEINYTLV